MNTFETLSLQDAQKHLQQQNTCFIDIRDEATYRQGHIPGALLISRESLNNFLAQEDKTRTYVVCCYRGNSSKQVAQIMCEAGFEHVYNLEGGFTAWQAAAQTNTDYAIELDA